MDHAGHTFSVHSPEMLDKVQQTDAELVEVRDEQSAALRLDKPSSLPPSFYATHGCSYRICPCLSRSSLQVLCFAEHLTLTFVL